MRAMLLKRGSLLLTILMLSTTLFGCAAGTNSTKELEEAGANKQIVELEDGQNISEIEKKPGQC